MRIFPIFATIAAMVGGSSSMAQQTAEPVQVMVLGTYHMANHGRDVHNPTADDVLSPRRQAELASVAAAVAEFRPTRVMVERQVERPDLAVSEYSSFTTADLARERSEVFQIGFRLARLVGLPTVEGVDEQTGSGEPDYFPYRMVEAYASANGQAHFLPDAHSEIANAVDAFNARQGTASVAELLIQMNDPAEPLVSHRAYYDMLHIGDRTAQPGAELNAFWYMRNAKIFAKLISLARPGDRIVIIYGAGHGYWLRHFSREVPGFVFADPRPYLARAAQAARSRE